MESAKASNKKEEELNNFDDLCISTTSMSTWKAGSGKYQSEKIIPQNLADLDNNNNFSNF